MERNLGLLHISVFTNPRNITESKKHYSLRYIPKNNKFQYIHQFAKMVLIKTHIAEIYSC